MKRRARRLLIAIGAAAIAVAGLTVAGAAAREIGGPFALIDHNGKRVTNADFRGRYLLIYFGYTYCPDVCPTELFVISQALDMLGEAAARVQPLMITIDPERDTPEELADYVANFHPRLIGLTGTPDAIAAVAKEYGVYYEKVYTQLAQGEDTEAAGASDPESEYLMSHSASTFLMGPDGRFIRTFAYGTSAAEMAQGIAEALAAAGE